AAAAADTDARDDGVLERIDDQRHYVAAFIASHRQLALADLAALAASLIENRRCLVHVLGRGEILHVRLARCALLVAHIAGNLHRHAVAERQALDLVLVALQQTFSGNVFAHIQYDYVHGRIPSSNELLDMLWFKRGLSPAQWPQLRRRPAAAAPPPGGWTP